MEHKLDRDMMDSKVIREKVKDEKYAQKLYAALCNIQWKHEDSDKYWTCSWRSSGGIVANLRFANEGYLDFYCSGIMGEDFVSEGVVDKEIEQDLAKLGWEWRCWPK